jgi:hypothetical protein
MFALSDVLDFLAYKFARLCRWRLALPLRAARPFDSFLFWHKFGSLQLVRLVVSFSWTISGLKRSGKKDEERLTLAMTEKFYRPTVINV